MGLEHHITEEQIRQRSYEIWESEGRQEGRSLEHWFMAKAELEMEFEQSCDVALSETETTGLTMPHPSISMPPHRHEAARIVPDDTLKAA
jgi:hypothetical protein